VDGVGELGRVLSVASALAAAGFFCVATRPFTRLLASLLLIGVVAANVVACGSGAKGPSLGERLVPIGQSAPKGGGVYRVGKPYELNGVQHYPREDPSYDRVGTASWYGELFHGRRTANGEIFDMERLSAASPTLPMPIYAKVTNLTNGRSIVVRVNDRGPFRSNRIIDLSRRSAEVLGFRERGTARVRVQYLRRAPLNGDDSYERRHLASQPWAQYAMRGQPEPAARDPVTVASIADAVMPRRAAKRSQPRPVSLVEEEAEAYAERPRSNADTAMRTVRTVAVQPPAPSPAGGSRNGPSIVAGSFRNKDNADRALTLLGGVAQVEVTPITIGDDTFYRVRVGPFADRGEAEAALVRVTGAGYDGARIVTN
jgi:rare lipoprotein A